ncbi:sensor histidine kinase [Nonomuraea fastidiosa]|uniref:sensor histidine kinase n=1 Tax=Nonomuraea TaxID=83681 RepID=UPI003254D191
MFGRVREWSRHHEKLANALWASPLALFCVLSAFASRGAGTSDGGAVPGLGGYLGLTALLLLPLLWRHRPVLSFAAIALVSFGQWLAGLAPMPANLAVLVALYAVAYRCRFRWAMAACLVAELGVAMVMINWDDPGLGLFFSSSIFVVTIWLSGLYASTRRRYLESLEERAERAERERDQQARMAAAAERARIARELHDVVAHNVSVMVVQADGAGYALDTDVEQARTAVKAISATGRAALAEMRRLLGVLRKTEDDSQEAEPGKAASERAGAADYYPQPGLAQLDELVATFAVPATLRVSGDPARLPEGQQLAVYRIVQEALTNVLKHGGPGASATVEIDVSGGDVQVRVTDDGRGAAASHAGGGHGLIGMRERAGMYGGAVSAGPRRGGGFEVVARLPLAREAA